MQTSRNPFHSGLFLGALAWMLLAAPSGFARAGDMSPAQLRQIFQANKTPLETVVVRPSSVERMPRDATLTLRPEEFLAVRLDEKPHMLPTTTTTAGRRDLRLQLPFGVLKAGDTEDKALLRAEVIVDGGGLAPVDGGFEGSLRLGLIDQRDATSRVTLAPPIQILVSASPATVSPGDFDVSQTNTYSAISVATRLAPSEVTVSIRPSFVEEPIDVTIPVLHRIVLRASPQQLQGFGLAKSRITVALEPAPSQPVTVRLSSDKGQPEPPTVTISDATPVYVELRSSGLGSAQVEAEADLAVDGSIQVDFVFPTAFLGASLLGGLLGALLRAMLARRKKPATKLPPHVVTGLIAGIFVAVLFTVGVNVLGIAFGATYGEALYFIVAGLGAYSGSEILKIGNIKAATS